MVKNRVVIDVSDARVSNDPADVLVTFSLGSCIAVCAYDRSARIGGMLHYQLPSSTMDPDRAKSRPLMYADTGIKALVDKLVSMGAKKKRLQVKVADGAAMNAGPKGFNLGKRNYLALRKIMWNNGMFIDSKDVGGSSPRNMQLNIADGTVTIKSNGLEKKL